MASGRMPHLAALRSKSARYYLDHGLPKFTGLAWEHFSTGQTPDTLNHHAAISFDPNLYHVRQNPTRFRPIFSSLDSRCVLFDVPYCDLQSEPRLRGVAGWGAHDPGVPTSSSPPPLLDEMAAQFGRYPAKRFVYGFVWQSPEQTRKAGKALAEAVRVRARAAEWMLKERLPDWDLGVIVVSEPHSAIEPLWHGIDPTHPLHRLPSAAIAREGLEAVYLETDALIGRFVRSFPDASLMVFAMHGMGSNDADLPSMVLLPELLYRRQFDRPYMRDLPWRSILPNGIPLLAEKEDWHGAMRERIPPVEDDTVQELLAGLAKQKNIKIVPEEIDWQPASRYRPFWPHMEAFALPSYYDGRVRINLAGRERYGMVSPNSYQTVIEDLKSLLNDCVDPLTSEPVVKGFHEPPGQPLSRGPSNCDLQIFWRGLPSGIQHAKYGRVGPIPYRRTGGHTGAHGFLYCCGGPVAEGDYGETSSFNVIPTMLSILNEASCDHAAGQSLVSGPFATI